MPNFTTISNALVSDELKNCSIDVCDAGANYEICTYA